MHSEIPSKWLALIGIVGLFFSLIIFLFQILNLSTQNFYTETVLAANSENQEEANTSVRQADLGIPVRLKIPKINVDAVLESVGLTSDGAMDVPKDPAKVAWYSLGSRPGESGSAVIAGHYDWINNKPAVFDSLHKLRKGDKVFIEDEEGDIIAFVVREMRVYNKDEDAFDVFISDDDQAHLNLITCAGAWDKIEKIYSERLVVFADKE